MSTAALSLSISLSSVKVSSSIFAACSLLREARLQRLVCGRDLVEFLLRGKPLLFHNLLFRDQLADLEVDCEESVVQLGLVLVELLDALFGLLAFLVDLVKRSERFGASCRARRRSC